MNDDDFIPGIDPLTEMLDGDPVIISTSTRRGIVEVIASTITVMLSGARVGNDNAIRGVLLNGLTEDNMVPLIAELFALVASLVAGIADEHDMEPEEVWQQMMLWAVEEMDEAEAREQEARDAAGKWCFEDPRGQQGLGDE